MAVRVRYDAAQRRDIAVNNKEFDLAGLLPPAVGMPPPLPGDSAGYWRRIAGLFKIPFDPNPSPTDATSIDRARFDEALDVLEAAGVPLVDDRNQAWRDFNGWRVNYDTVLRGLERLTIAPTPWWERPMRSAWVTDEPALEAEAGAGEIQAKATVIV